jgi:hypothetical protein
MLGKKMPDKHHEHENKTQTLDALQKPPLVEELEILKKDNLELAPQLNKYQVKALEILETEKASLAAQFLYEYQYKALLFLGTDNANLALKFEN